MTKELKLIPLRYHFIPSTPALRRKWEQEIVEGMILLRKMRKALGSNR